MPNVSEKEGSAEAPWEGPVDKDEDDEEGEKMLNWIGRRVMRSRSKADRFSYGNSREDPIAPEINMLDEDPSMRYCTACCYDAL